MAIDFGKPVSGLSAKASSDLVSQLGQHQGKSTNGKSSKVISSIGKGISKIGRGLGNMAVLTGLGKDYNPDKGIFGEDEDGNKTTNIGQIVGNISGNTGRLLGFGANFIEQQDVAHNKYNDVLAGTQSKIDDALIASGNPYAALYGGLHKLTGKLGLNVSSDGNLLNTAASFVPGLGLLGTKSDKFIERADVNASSMYHQIGNTQGKLGARGYSGGRFLKNGAENNNAVQTENLYSAIASKDILDPGKRDWKSAFDKRWGQAAAQTLSGSDELLYKLSGKNGMVLLFSKRTLSKHNTLKKLLKGGEFVVKHDIDKLSIPSLEDFLEEKRQLWTEKAIQKATTRNAPYMFKNPDWKNCIATAFDSYGLYDKNGLPLVTRNADFIVDPKQYGFLELPFGDTIDTLPDGVLILDYNNPNNRSIPGHAIILTGRDENGVPIYSWSSGNNEIEDMHPHARLYSFYWTDKVKPKAYRFIGTPEQIENWTLEYNNIYNVVQHKEGGTIELFKAGGEMNVIPSGALHAHKHHLEEIDEKFEDVTTKGIPVVVESEGGNLIQQAEVEKEEIIFRLEVTKKLEELAKEGTNEAAIKAGKLLCKEILHNTDDKTGEMI